MFAVSVQRFALLVAVLMHCMHAVHGIPIGGLSGSSSTIGGRQRDLIVAVRSKASQHEFDEVWAAMGDMLEHLELDDVCAAFGPLTLSVNAVHKWAAAHNSAVVAATRFSFPRFLAEL